MATTMTEIPIKDLALTTAPAGKQLLVRDASAGLQRIDYAQIAKNLVESYGSSSLAGKNQSIKAAIDSLNSGLTQCNTNITTINNSLSNINLYRFFDVSCTHRGSGQYDIGNFELPSGSQLLFAAITYNGYDSSQKIQLRFNGITQNPWFNDSTGGDDSKECIAIGFNTSTKSTQVHLYMQTSFTLDQTSTASILAIRIQN